MSMENALALTITAFDKVKPTSRKKRETLALCFEQVKGILKDFMREKGIPLVEVNLETKEALVVEPIPNMIKQAWVQEWLNGELSTEQFEKWLNCKFQNTHYVNFADFLRDVEAWLLEKKGKRRMVCHG
ncbi:MAG: hypothetical protein QXG39_07505 [Candidatus Aenigmatarchaeota archaeon]